MLTATENPIRPQRFDQFNWERIERQLRQTRSEDQEAGRGRHLCCSHCRRSITREDLRILVQGRHEHVYSNPHGIVFEIGCFASAPGCQSPGVPTQEWSWFRGCAWQIAICQGCGEHLGWRYTGADTFYGLILKRLAPAGDSQA